jgi:hypothetical protein
MNDPRTLSASPLNFFLENYYSKEKNEVIL